MQTRSVVWLFSVVTR